MNEPLISVLLSSTGRVGYLRQTIESFLEHNTYPNVEFCIVESLPTPEARLTFNFTNRNTEECQQYITELKTRGLTFPVHYWEIPWMPMGNVMNYLLAHMHGEYYYWIEDDWLTVADPNEMFCDAMVLMKDDKDLNGLRFCCEKAGYFADIISEEVGAYFDRNGYPKERYQLIRHPVTNYWIWPLGGGCIFGSKHKFWCTGTIIPNHPLKDFWWGETSWSMMLTNQNKYIGIMKKYFGCLISIGDLGSTGTDRFEFNQRQKQFVIEGRIGKRPTEDTP